MPRKKSYIILQRVQDKYRMCIASVRCENSRVLSLDGQGYAILSDPICYSADINVSIKNGLIPKKARALLSISSPYTHCLPDCK